jgi:hypothetical protein
MARPAIEVEIAKPGAVQDRRHAGAGVAFDGELRAHRDIGGVEKRLDQVGPQILDAPALPPVRAGRLAIAPEFRNGGEAVFLGRKF